MRRVEVLNMTRLFDKEMLIYSFFDIKLKKPARVIFILYAIVLLVPWVLFWSRFLEIGPWSVAWMLIPPIGLASLMSQPRWGGKKFYEWAKCQIKYMGEPKYFYDLNPGKKLQSVKIDHTYQVSRRRDYLKLAKIKEKEMEQYGK